MSSPAKRAYDRDRARRRALYMDDDPVRTDPPAQGIWKMGSRGEWFRVELVECSQQFKPLTHGRLVGNARSLCGRGVVFERGVTDTDSPRDIHCERCRRSL